MTTPGGQWGGTPPLERTAAAAVGGLRLQAGLVAPRLSEGERREAAEIVAQRGTCRFCAGLHAGGDLACPRLASFEVDGDGNVRKGTFWRDGEWDTSRVLFAEDINEDDEDGRGADS